MGLDCNTAAEFHVGYFPCMVTETDMKPRCSPEKMPLVRNIFTVADRENKDEHVNPDVRMLAQKLPYL